MKQKIVSCGAVLLALAVATGFFLKWNPEAFFLDRETPVTLADVKKDRSASFVGMPAGADIPRLSGAAEFTELSARSDYVTAEPIGIVSTQVYSLKSWADPNQKRRVNGRMVSNGRKEQLIQSDLDIWEDYNRFDLLELPDHSYILAQIPAHEASALKRGEAVTLSVGQKIGLTKEAQDKLAEICAEYGVKADKVFYAIRDAWYKEHGDSLFLIRFGAATVLFFVLAVVLILIGNWLFRVRT